jgi:hypothetical protein
MMYKRRSEMQQEPTAHVDSRGTNHKGLERRRGNVERMCGE